MREKMLLRFLIPRRSALLETTAEVLLGLEKAYQDFEDRHERAWKGAAG
jgi:hypothetical protein